MASTRRAKHGHRWNKGFLPKKRVKRKCQCGVSFTATRYLTDRYGWGGSSLCRKCSNERLKAWQRAPSGHWSKCAGCGKAFMATNRQWIRLRMGHRGTCQKACVSRVMSSYPTFKEHRWCLAPVPGGCDGIRPIRLRKDGRPHGHQPYCHAHKKRKDRGGRLDTPIAWRR